MLQQLSPSTFRSGVKIDHYILGWWATGIALGAMAYVYGPAPALPLWPRIALFAIAGLRLTDITQLVVNAGLFDHLSFSRPQTSNAQQVENVTRSVVLLVLNYLELVVWFSLLYVALNFVQPASFWSRFYFGVVTQLTVGYGDIEPVGATKAIAGVQVVLGWGLTVLVVARFLGGLPPVQAQALPKRRPSGLTCEGSRRGVSRATRLVRKR